MESKTIIDIKMEKALYPIFGNLSEIIVAVNKKKIKGRSMSEDEYAKALEREVLQFIRRFAGDEMAKRTEEELLKNFKIKEGK
jgi:hypothetical protein